MSVATKQPSGASFDVEPRTEATKIREKLGRWFTEPTRRNAAVDHEPGTVEKAVMNVIGSILFKTGTDDANTVTKAILGGYCSLLNCLLDLPDPIPVMQAIVDEYHLDGGANLVGVDRKTVDAMIPRKTREELSQDVTIDYQENIQTLKVTGACGEDVVISGDDTADKVRSDHPNGNMKPVRVGGQPTWDDGFEYEVEYDGTNSLFLGCRHRDNWSLPGDSGAWHLWVGSVQSKVTSARASGVRVAGLHFDRGFFLGVIFACALFGMFVPGALAGEQPRVVMPRKFSCVKDSFKWNYLLDASKPQVFVEHMIVDTRKHVWIHGSCDAQLKRVSDHEYEVSYACVALAGEYGGKTGRTIDDVRVDARRVRDGIETTQKLLAKTERAYKKNRKKLKVKKPAKPSYGRGRRRTAFKDTEDRRLYRECLRLHADLAKLKVRKTVLIKEVLFFAVSLRPGEDPASDPGLFIALAKDYHARWGIENGISDVKHRFRRMMRSRKPTRRQFFTGLAMVIHNHWQVVRKQEILDWLRRTSRGDSLFDATRLWIRIPWEREAKGLTTAVGFLATIWVEAFTSVLKSKISEVH